MPAAHDAFDLLAVHRLPALKQQIERLQQQVPGIAPLVSEGLTAEAALASAVVPEMGRGEEAIVSSGCEAFDRLLPTGGFPRGCLVEWLGSQPGGGVGSLALLVARQACQAGGTLVVMDPGHRFYPPAAAAWGVDLERLIVVRPEDESGLLWAMDQALRCPAVAAVWASLSRLEGRWFRRFQLAAESSGCLGMFLRPARAQGRPSWAYAQLLVEPRLSTSGRRLHVKLVRCRGQGRLGNVNLEIDEWSGALQAVPSRHHETHPLSLAAQLAHPKIARRSTGT